jgi:hypothetical protein
MGACSVAPHPASQTSDFLDLNIEHQQLNRRINHIEFKFLAN